MSDKTRCPICGKRLASGTTQTQKYSWGSVTFRLYLSNSTEPTCFGHENERIAVPQAFQDAFNNEDLQL